MNFDKSRILAVIALGLISVSIVACGGGDSDSAPAQSAADDSGSSGEGAISFDNIQCVPDIASGATLVAGNMLACSFDITGDVDADLALSCERLDGTVYECQEGGTSTVLRPFGEWPLPILGASLIHPTNVGATGSDGVIVKVEGGGVTVEHRFAFDYGPDDPQNHAPSISFNCDQPVEHDVIVVDPATTIRCAVTFGDPDPHTLTWTVSEQSGATPVNPARPFSGSGNASLIENWSWITDASESGTEWKYDFEVSDGTNAPVSRTLTVRIN